MNTSPLHKVADEFLVRYGGDRFENLFKTAKGSIVTDDTGREILDFTSGQMCATIGHNHPAITAYSEARFFGLFRVIFWTLILRNLSLDSASIGLVPHRIDSFNSQFILVEIQ